jgi:hypothetical protein
MNRQLIRDLAITGGIYDCICDPYDKLKNGDPYSSVMVDLERFAEKIVRECAKVAWYHTPDTEDLEYSHLIKDKILEHFGVEE